MSPDEDLDALIAARARALRDARSLSLDALAARSGVSRAMLSRIERGESSPTAGLLMKLCKGLGVTLPALLDGEVPSRDTSLARRSDQPLWRDPASGYLRRTVSPSGAGSGVERVEIAEVEMPVGAAVLLDPLDGTHRDRQVWVLDGAVEVARGSGAIALGTGDCLRLEVAGPTGLRNIGPTVARCAVVTGRAGGPERSG